VSFHVRGESGPITWHAKALQTSYLTAPGSGSKSADETRPPSPSAPRRGSSSTRSTCAPRRQPGGGRVRRLDHRRHDVDAERRRPLADVLARRLRAKHGNRVAVVNAGIGGTR